MENEGRESYEYEMEEEERAEMLAMEDDETLEAQARVSALAKTIRKKKGIIKEKARVARKNNHPTMSRAVAARTKSVGEFSIKSLRPKESNCTLVRYRRASIKSFGIIEFHRIP